MRQNMLDFLRYFDKLGNMKTDDAVTALAAMAQATRLAVFRLLVQQGPTGLAAGEIAAKLDISPATLSFHLKELNRAGLVQPRQDGRFIYYAADFSAMNELIGFLTENCCAADCTSCGPVDATARARKSRRKERA
jgi:ArsR family transcriptional regulator, arsenate/arsenite/antimonite-responsive transcriptional repressor